MKNDNQLYDYSISKSKLSNGLSANSHNIIVNLQVTTQDEKPCGNEKYTL